MDVMIDWEDGRSHPFDNLSDGQRNVMALVGDIAVKAAQLNPHLGKQVLDKTAGVVLIDELDLHLHPRWQRRIVADLKRCFPLVQFFCTTHSPIIIGEVPREEIVVMHDDGTTGQPSVAYGADANWILTHVMNGLERNEDITKLIAEISHDIEDGKLHNVGTLLSKLKSLTGEFDGEYIRLRSWVEAECELMQARIDKHQDEYEADDEEH
jgi:predicted ATP-binding protein involved in virulence